MGARITFRGAWDSFINFFNAGRARRGLQEELRRRVLEQCHLLRRDVLEYIDSEKHGVPNSPLTVMVKRSSRPLVDRGDLRQSISAEAEATAEGVAGAVGVKRSARGKGGKGLANVAAALHDGFRIRVTPKVRAAIFAEMRKRAGRGKQTRGRGGRFAKGRGVKVDAGGLSGAGASTWVVRGRPFILEPFQQAEQRIQVALGEGVRVTLKKL